MNKEKVVMFIPLTHYEELVVDIYQLISEEELR